MTMTDKAYIVANKKQELDVLKKFEENELVWFGGEKPTECVPSKLFHFKFPYALIEDKAVSWSSIVKLDNETIVYDGRKEGKMDKKHKVTQEFMDELIKWRDEYTRDCFGVDAHALDYMPKVVDNWRFNELSSYESNRRFGAIINWINGEDVFEVENPHKFVVRSDKKDHDGDYAYVVVENDMTTAAYTFVNATKFDTREEAQEWANSHQVVVEID